MNESLDQQTGHRPAPSTGSRQVGQSCGSATSSTSPKLARKALLSRAKRLAGTVSPCMADTLTPQVANLNGVAGNCGALVPLRGDPTSSLRPRRGNEKEMVSAHPLVFDRRRQRTHRMRAAALGPSTFLIERVAEDLSDRLATVLRRFECALDLGTPTDAVRRVLAASGKVGTIIAADALAGGAAVARRRVRESMAQGERPGQGERTSERMLGVQLVVAADEEALPFRDASLDLVVSALALQFVNDLPGTLIQIRRALKPDGLLLAALAGGDTLTELRQAFAAAEAEIEDGISPRVVPFSDVRDMGALLQRAGFALPVTDVDRVTARYASPISLMHDLRRMGATNALLERSRRPLKRATLKRMTEIYAERFADRDGRIRATFEIVWLCGWAPHASQQKPLAPGSARERLADVLGTKEIRLPRTGDGNQ
jgi:SAM-dependent methyltransferase